MVIYGGVSVTSQCDRITEGADSLLHSPLIWLTLSCEAYLQYGAMARIRWELQCVVCALVSALIT